MMRDIDAVETLLYREARLLDEGRFDEWLDLFTSDAVYWIPAGHFNINPEEHVSILYDTRQDMERRVARLKSGFAHAEDPASRTHRVVSNIVVEDYSTGKEKLIVSSVMVLFALSKHKQAIHSARCEFILRRTNSGWKIERKKVGLLRSDEALDNIPYLV